MAEAMALVRDELGADALILGTRRVDGGVEITVAVEPPDQPAAAALEPPPAPVQVVDTERLTVLDFHGVPMALRNALKSGPLEGALAAALPFGALPLGAGDRPLLIVGPPGAGKTLTVARLATRLMIGGTSPMVTTADGKRAGATEQLAAFTRLLGIPLTVASHPVTLGRALGRRQDGAPVLIDTAGSDPFHPGQAEELRALAASANAITVLVLPAGFDAAEATDLALAYAEAGATLLIGTRLDVSRRLGGLLAAASVARLVLTEAGISPAAANGLTPLTPAELVDRLMHMPMRTGHSENGRHAA
jgi:flagellar biosynthesis protein FlhF